MPHSDGALPAVRIARDRNYLARWPFPLLEMIDCRERHSIPEKLEICSFAGWPAMGSSAAASALLTANSPAGHLLDKFSASAGIAFRDCVTLPSTTSKLLYFRHLGWYLAK